MISFGNFQPKSRKYVALELSESSRKELQNWCKFCGFDVNTSYSGEHIDDMDYHITVFYSENTSSLKEGIFKIPEFTVETANFELLGEEKNVPVLIIQSNDNLEKVYDYFKNTGLESKWPDWKIHVSLSYKYSGTPRLEDLVLPHFPLHIDTLKIENIREEA